MATESEKQKLLDEIDSTNENDVEAQNLTRTDSAQSGSNGSIMDRINMKYVSLVMLVAQNASLVLLTRWAKTREGNQFVSTTAVVIGELGRERLNQR